MDYRIEKPGTHVAVLESDGDSNASRDASIYKQTRVKRIFNFVQMFFLSLTFMSGWEVMALSLYSVFYNGGPQTFAWGILLAVIGALSQAASLAELSSMQPIAGAQYHWTHLLAPSRGRNFITWIQGWVTWWAWISTFAGVLVNTALMLQGIIIMNVPGITFENWHTTLLIYAQLAISVIMNAHFFWAVPWIELVSGALHITLFVIYTVVLLSLSKHHSTSFVFFDRVDSAKTSGWTNSFVSWNLGLLTPIWGNVGMDSAVHLSEEVRKSKLAVPRTIFWSILINGVMAYSFVLTILYSSGNISEALASPTGQPFLHIAQHVTGSTQVATAMGCGLLAVSLSVNLSTLASVSRLTWAWARDGGLPSYFANVSEKRNVPVRAVYLSTFIVAILALLNIPTTVAFQAFIALATLGLCTSYLIAIACMLHNRFQPLKDRQPLGQWNLGRYGVYINIFAVVYTLYIIIWLPFPSGLPVTAENLNWAGPIFGFVLVAATALWFIRSNFWTKWPGPRAEIIEKAVTEN